MLAPGSSSYPIARPTGVCASTGKAMAVGERFMATLVEIEGQPELRRADFSLEAWGGGARPEVGRVFAAWNAVLPEPNAKKKSLLSDDELIEIFEQLAPATERRQLVFRYMLALTLLRRRILRHDGVKGTSMIVKRRGPAGTEAEAFEVQDPGMDEAAISEAMEELSKIIPMDEEASGGGS
jgi:hypothetical protein